MASSATREMIAQEKIEEIENELQCNICQEYFTRAFTLNCSHSFCYNCIHTWQQNNNICPLCRQFITGIAPCRALDNMVATVNTTASSNLSEAVSQEDINLGFDNRFATSYLNRHIHWIDDDLVVISFSSISLIDLYSSNPNSINGDHLLQTEGNHESQIDDWIVSGQEEEANSEEYKQESDEESSHMITDCRNMACSFWSTPRTAVVEESDEEL